MQCINMNMEMNLDHNLHLGILLLKFIGRGFHKLSQKFLKIKKPLNC